MAKSKEADAWISKSLDIAVKAGDELGVASTLGFYVHYLYISHSKEKMESLFKFGLKFCKNEYTLARAMIMCNLGELYQKYDEFDKAKEAYKEFIVFDQKRVKKLKDSWYLQKALEKLGDIHRRQGRWQKCLSLYKIVWKVKHNEKSLWGDAGLLNVIAETYLKMGNLKKALEEHEKSLTIVRKTEGLILLFYILGTGINIYLELGDFKNALAKVEELYNKAKGSDAKNYIGVSLNMLGLIHLYKGQFKKSQIYLYKALTIRKELSDEGAIGNSYFSIAKLHYKTEEYLKALEYIDSAITIMNKYLHYERGQAYLLKIQIEISLGNKLSYNKLLQDTRKIFTEQNRYFRLCQCDSIESLILWFKNRSLLGNKSNKLTDSMLDNQRKAKNLVEGTIKYFKDNNFKLLEVDATEITGKIILGE